MIPLILDNVEFQVWGDKTLWSPPSADGGFVEAPAEWSELARALACCDYEAQDGHVYIHNCQVLEAVLDDAARPIGLHIPLKAGASPMRAKRVETGNYEGEKIVSVVEWDDPLDQVLTAGEADVRFGKKEGTAAHAIREGQLFSRKSKGTHLVRLCDAQMRWS